MLVTALSHRLVVALAAGVVVGLGGAAAMVLPPYAAALAPPRERGRSTGTVMSGVLLEILFSRGVGGLVSTAFTWRGTYLAGAAVASVIAGVSLLDARMQAHLGLGCSHLALAVLRIGRSREQT